MKAVYAIFATYFYFLLFAQFSFLEHVKVNVAADKLNYVMSAMGGMGLLSSLFTIVLLKKNSAKNLISLGFLFCGLASRASIYATSLLELCVVAGVVGSSLAILTVSLASIVGDYFKHLGLGVGIGTGLAYFICNVPQVFSASNEQQALLVTIACLVGSLLFFLKQEYSLQKNSQALNITPLTISPSNISLLNISPWQIVIAFVALVWFDCAAFYVIQSAGELKSLTWQGNYRLWSNSIIHLLFALLAGVLIDRNQIKQVMTAAFVFLSIGVLTLANFSFFSAPFYCAGVSFYSTALVAFPTLTNEKKQYFAGITYAVAGWFGSAMGIGMAQDLKNVPLIFIFVAGIILMISLFGYKSKRLDL